MRQTIVVILMGGEWLIQPDNIIYNIRVSTVERDEMTIQLRRGDDVMCVMDISSSRIFPCEDIQTVLS